MQSHVFLQREAKEDLNTHRRKRMESAEQTEI